MIIKDKYNYKGLVNNILIKMYGINKQANALNF